MKQYQTLYIPTDLIADSLLLGHEQFSEGLNQLIHEQNKQQWEKDRQPKRRRNNHPPSGGGRNKIQWWHWLILFGIIYLLS